MICYLDRTFCTHYQTCGIENCSRALTPEVTEKANKWWKNFKSDDEAPICVFADVPDCHTTKINNS